MLVLAIYIALTEGFGSVVGPKSFYIMRLSSVDLDQKKGKTVDWMSCIFCQLPCDAPLRLSTSLQLADMEQREGRRPPPNLGTLNIPLDTCQDSQAAARQFQLRLPHPPASIPAWLTPGGPPKPLPPPLAYKLDKKEGVTQTPQTSPNTHKTVRLKLSNTSFTQSPAYDIIMKRSSSRVRLCIRDYWSHAISKH